MVHAFENLTDEETLTLMVYGEARGEVPLGQIAVAYVALNRSKDPRWPDTVKDVCLQHLQFSCFNPSDPNYDYLVSFAEIHHFPTKQLDIARQVLSGAVPDPTRGATHYHTLTITPIWAHRLTKTVTIGHHVFYK